MKAKILGHVHPLKGFNELVERGYGGSILTINNPSPGYYELVDYDDLLFGDYNKAEPALIISHLGYTIYSTAKYSGKSTPKFKILNNGKSIINYNGVRIATIPK